MKQELSILIPTFNHPCAPLVQQLSAQLANLDIQHYEIIVAEDGSSLPSALHANACIRQLSHCRYIVNTHNMGRAGIRNFLAQQAQYQWLLFIDADMKIISPDFLRRYLLTHNRHHVVYGGNSVHHDQEKPECSLRFRYEKQGEINAQKRPLTDEARGNRNIHTSNLLIKRALMLDVPFDETITRYGYEDILLGKDLLLRGIHVHYLNNPVGFTAYDDNALYLQKVEVDEFVDGLIC